MSGFPENNRLKLLLKDYPREKYFKWKIRLFDIQYNKKKFYYCSLFLTTIIAFPPVSAELVLQLYNSNLQNFMTKFYVMYFSLHCLFFFR